MKKFFIFFSILAVLTVAFVLIVSNRRTTPWDEWVRQNVSPPAIQENNPTVADEGITPKKETKLALEKKAELTPELEPVWKKWVDEWMKKKEAAHKEWIMRPENRAVWEEHPITEAEMLAKISEATRAQYVAKAHELKNEYGEPSKDMEYTINVEFELPRIPHFVYEGPQNVKALMETFDEKYQSQGRVQEMDEKYPREEWLQMFVDNGYDILDQNDYRSALGLRYDVERVKNDPELWRSGSLDIPPTDDWETYKEAYIDINVSMHQRIHTAAREDPEYTGGFIPHSHPDVFLRYNGSRVYVKRNGLATSFYGRDLTNEQQRELTHYGVHPEGVEVIYIDEDYNVLDERPPLITPDMMQEEVPPFITPDMLRYVELPPNDWTPPRGWEPPPGLEEALKANGWRGSFAPQEVGPTGKPSAPDNSFAEQTDRAAQDAREQYENAQREFDRFAGMSDDEMEAEFEKLLRDTFPELPPKKNIDSAFRELFETRRISPKRLNRAFNILDQHGPERGIRMIKEVDPEAAAQIERILSIPPKEEKPPPTD